MKKTMLFICGIMAALLCAGCSGGDDLTPPTVVIKYICPKDNKEYDTAEAAAACCGVQTVTKYICSGCNVEYSTKAEADACRCYFDNLTVLPKDFVKIPGTTLDIKSTYTSDNNYSRVLVQGRKIKIRDMLVCNHEVTQREFARYCKYPYKATSGGENFEPTNTLGKGDNYPAYFVSWYNAVRYCNMRSLSEGLTPCYTINDKDGKPTTDPDKWFTIDNSNDVPTSNDYTAYITRFNKVVCDFDANGYRLPTEAEWEYLASANTTNDYAGSSNIDSVAWYSQNADGKVHEVKGKSPNVFGLYDMSGNVGEWCWDWWIIGSKIDKDTPETGVATQQTESNYARGRIFKGGSINSAASYCTVYSHTESYNERQPYSYGTKTNFEPVGFRVVRTITK